MSVKNVSVPDFDEYKESLKDFLRSQNQFEDYDFDGSAISTLLDLLAYNTTINAFNATMVSSERFLKIAQRRGSVISGASTLGYTPRSASSAKAVVTLQLDPTQNAPSAITVPKYTKFTSKAGNQSFTFYTDEDIIIQEDQGLYRKDITIGEGKFFSHTFPITESQPSLRLPNQNVDTSRLTVKVFESQTDNTGVTYKQAEEFVQVTNDSQVYFLEEREDEHFYIVFGDGIIGKAVEPGQVVVVEYFKTRAAEANGANTFTVASSIPNTTGASVIEVVEKASGGAPKEGINSIRKKARSFYQRQNRTVTRADYASIVPTIIPSVRTATAWGGEDNVPPAFGKVFISAITEGGFNLSERQKEDIKQELGARYNVTGIEPIVVDPVFKTVNVSTRADYDSSVTNPGATALRNSIIQQILNYSSNSLEDFNQSLRFSQLVTAIDNTHPSVVGNTTTYTLTVEPQSIDEFVVDPSISFDQSVKPNTLTTQRFDYLGFSNVIITDDGTGNISARRFIGSSKLIDVQPDIGTISYATGEIQFTNKEVLKSDAIQQQNIQFTVETVDLDIIPERNEIIKVDPSTIQVSLTDIITGITVGAF